MSEGMWVRLRHPGQEVQNFRLLSVPGYEVRTEGGHYDPATGFHVFEGARASLGVAIPDEVLPGDEITALEVFDEHRETVGRIILRPWRFRILRPERFAGRVVRCLEVRRGVASDGSDAYLLEDETDRYILNEADVERLTAG